MAYGSGLTSSPFSLGLGAKVSLKREKGRITNLVATKSWEYRWETVPAERRAKKKKKDRYQILSNKKLEFRLETVLAGRIQKGQIANLVKMKSWSWG